MKRVILAKISSVSSKMKMCFYFLSSHLFFSKELVSTFIKLSVNFCSFLKYKSDLLFQVSGVKIHRGNSVQSVDDSSVKFAMRNGKIEHVCLLDASEPKWMVNFKKGIISSLQSSVTDWSKSTNVTEVKITCGIEVPTKQGIWCHFKKIISFSLIVVHWL